MSKKNPTKLCQPYPPRPVKVADKTGDELIAFPCERNILTGRQREVPNPAGALAKVGQPSERAQLRARREAQQIIAAAEKTAPTVREDLQAVRRRPWDAPMATPVTQLPQEPAPMICGLSGIVDPIATLAWDAVMDDTAVTVRSWWTRGKTPLAVVAAFLAGLAVGIAI